MIPLGRRGLAGIGNAVYPRGRDGGRTSNPGPSGRLGAARRSSRILPGRGARGRRIAPWRFVLRHRVMTVALRRGLGPRRLVARTPPVLNACHAGIRGVRDRVVSSQTAPAALMPCCISGRVPRRALTSNGAGL